MIIFSLPLKHFIGAICVDCYNFCALLTLEICKHGLFFALVFGSMITMVFDDVFSTWPKVAGLFIPLTFVFNNNSSLPLLLSTFDICIHFDFKLLAFLHPTCKQLLHHAKVLHGYPYLKGNFNYNQLFWQVPNIFVTIGKRTLSFLNNSNFQVKVLNLYNIQPMNSIVGPIQLVFTAFIMHLSLFAFSIL